MSSIIGEKVIVMHSSPLIAAGLGCSLEDHFEVSVHASTRLDDRTTYALMASGGAVIADFHSALTLLARSRSAPWMRVQPPRCLVVAPGSRSVWVRQAINHGVLGYVTQDCAVDELIDVVRCVQRGQRALCNVAAAHLAESLAHEALTPRETEVLQLLARGLDNKTIASDLAISLGTVKTHVKAVLEKLSAASRTHAAALALHRGLIVDGAAMMTTGRPRAERSPTAVV